MSRSGGQTHPFGREAEVSAQRLLQSLCNHIKLGQWELAAACLTELLHHTDLLGEDLSKILFSIVTNHRNITIPSESVPSAHHLSWLVLGELKKTKHTRDDFDAIEKEVEFRLLTFEYCKDVDTDILQELYQFFLMSVGLVNKAEDLPSCHVYLSAKAQEYVSSLLLSNPQTGHRIIRYLLSDNPKHEENNQKLHHLELKCLQILLAEIINSQSDEHSDLELLQKRFLDLLTCYDPPQTQDKEDLTTFMRTLVNFQHDTQCSSPEICPRNQVIPCLLGKSDCDLLRLYFEFENSLRETRICAGRSDAGIAETRTSFSDRSQLWLSFSDESDREKAWRNMFLTCLKLDRHFLEIFAEVALHFIQKRDIERLTRLFQPEEFSLLKPVILLLGWSHCADVETARDLLNVLWDSKSKPLSEQISASCERLSHQVELTEWCLDKVRSLSGGRDSPVNSSIRSFVQGLELHSALHILHHSTRLSALDTREVLDFLRDSPVLQSAAVIAPTAKKVHFSQDVVPGDTTTDFSPERERDVSTFRAFCVLCSIMEVVTWCAETQCPWQPPGVAPYRHHDSSDKTALDNLLEEALTDSEEARIAKRKLIAERRKYCDDYRQHVSSKLDDVRSHLSCLFPINLRLEVLENIFSLLFTTRRDFRGAEVLWDSGDEGAVGERPTEDDVQHDLSNTETQSHDTVDLDLEGVRDTTKDVTKESEGLSAASSDRVSMATSLRGLGFVVSELVLRDVLLFLREMLDDLGRVWQTISQTGVDHDSAVNVPSRHQHDKLVAAVSSSIPPDQVQRRRSQLSQYLSEALWRLQLVAPDWLPKDYGTLPDVNFNVGQHYQSEHSLDELTVEETLAETQPPERADQGSRRVSISLSDTSSAVVTTATTDGSQSATSSGSVSRCRRRRRRSERRVGGQGSEVSDLVRVMLSDSDSLLNMCLKQGNFRQAAQVVKMFALDAYPQAREARFAELYQVTAERVRSLTPPTPAPRPGRVRVGGGTLSAIASVAAAGLSSLSVSNVVDQILSQSDLPDLGTDGRHVTPGDRSGVTPGNLDTLLHVCLDPGNTAPAIILDLVCTACNTWDKAYSLLNMADKRLPVTGKTDVSSLGHTPRIRDILHKHKVSIRPTKSLGFASLLHRLLSSLALGTNASESSASYYCRSACQLLTTASVPLDAAQLKTYVNSVTTVGKELKHVAKILKAKGVRSHGTRQEPANQGEPSVVSAVKTLHVYLQRNSPQGGWIDSLLNREPRRGSHLYLQLLLDHVGTLAETVGRLGKDPSRALLQEPFYVLSESLTSLFGRLIYNAHVDPASLESVCDVLHIDLVRVLLNSCCPDVPLNPQPTHNIPMTPNPAAESSPATAAQPRNDSKVVLNDFPSRSQPRSRLDPEVTVRRLLTELTTLMAEAAKDAGSSTFTQTTAEALIRTKKHCQVLEKTGILQNIDLRSLSSSQQKLCFYGNLLTLMGVHIWLHLLEAGEDLPGSRQLTADLDLDMWLLLRHSKLCYRVGQLGEVSYLDLKYVITRRGLPAPSSLGGMLQKYIKDLDAADPWVVFSPPPEPRLTFVTPDGTPDSPPLTILHPALVNHQLRTATDRYLATCVIIDRDTKTVRMSPLLSWYREDFLIHGSDNPLYSSLKDNLPETHRQSVLQALFQNNSGTSPRPRYLSRVLEYRVTWPQYTFSAETWRRLQQQSVITSSRRASYPTCDSRGRSWPPSRDTHTSHDLHPLTHSVLSYLRQHDGLLTTVAVVMCADGTDQITKEMAEDHFMSSGNKSADRDRDRLSPVDAERVTMLKERYPTLGRHLWSEMSPSFSDLASYPSHPDLSSVTGCLSTLPPDARASLLQASDSPAAVSRVSQSGARLLADSRWSELTRLVLHLPRELLDTQTDLRVLRDVCLCAAVTGRLGSADTDPRTLLAISDPELRARMVLGTLTHWEEGVCLQLLTACLQREGDGSAVQMLVEKRLREMKVFEKITTSAKQVVAHLNTSDPFTVSGRFGESQEQITDTNSECRDRTNEILTKLCGWQGVVEVSSRSPEMVLEVLTHCKDFETAYEWAEIYQMFDRFESILTEVHVSSVLDRSSTDTTTAFKVLDKLRSRDAARCYDVCSGLLDKLPNPAHVMFVTRFLITQLRSDLGERRLKELTTLCVGCKAVISLPVSERGDYEHLVSEPLLLLEQLLMNAKVDSAKRVLSLYSAELQSPEADRLSFTAADCDKLLETYAAKALEFPVVDTFDSADPLARGPSRPVSVVSVASSSRLQRRHNTMATLSGLGTAPRPVRRTGSAQFLAVPAAGSLPIPSTRTLPQIPTEAPASWDNKPSLVSATRRPFTVPALPPNQEDWVPDSAVTVCMVCQVEHFSMFNRRHHCRRCGRVVCGTCSQRTTIVFGKSARTCDDCYKHTFPAKPQEEPSDLQRLRDKLSTFSPTGVSGSLSPTARSHINITVGSVSPPDGSPGTTAELPATAAAAEFLYILSEDAELNQSTRDEFYYDYAPSTSLSLSLLDLHSRPATCADVILRLCDDVSTHLQSSPRGVRNPEVDYGLVISMMKSLLMSAKVKYLRSGDPGAGLSQCGVFLDRVNILDLLLENNCSYLPSINQLTKPDVLRRLRDRLLEEERFLVAVEMSTKCGLDPAGVWSAWGLACLRVGDFTAARDKFNKCLKTPRDKHRSLSQVNQKILSDILEATENSSATPGQNLLSSLSSVKSLLADPKPRPREDWSPDDPQLQESLYYLQTYGSHVSMVTYYRGRQQLSRAVHYVLDQKCSSDVFLEGLFLPCLASGGVGHLLEQLRLVDPSLTRWMSYLTAACKHLDKHRNVHMLYQLQLFMKDNLRAAMTAITHFYQHGSRDYVDLHTRLPHLHTARRHMDTYLADRPWGGNHGNPPDPARLILTPADVNKLILTIDTQVEVTKFLYQYHDNYEAVRGVMVTKRVPSERGVTAATTEPPTLFGSTKMKAEVTSLVLLSGNNIHDGYGLAFRIIQHFKLDASSVYTCVGAECGHARRYDRLKQVLSCIRDSGMCNDRLYDDVVDACVQVAIGDSSQAKELDGLIKLFRSDTKKLETLIASGKLRSAYLLAVKLGSVADVSRIHQVAQETGQSAVAAIAKQYLQKQQK